MQNLEGKVAFVTGAASGIGLGIARACLDAGMRVALADIDEAELAWWEADLPGGAATALTVTLDVADRDSWERAAARVHETFGAVDLLVNNAGISTNGLRFEDAPQSLWTRVVDVNLLGAVHGVRTFIDDLRSGQGHIVNTSSVVGLLGRPLLTPYAATKSGLVGLSEALRRELAEDGVGVSVLCPGRVRSRLSATSRADREFAEVAPPTDDTAYPDMLEPDLVGRLTVAGVRADAPYIFTHSNLRRVLESRHRTMLECLDQLDAALAEPTLT